MSTINERFVIGPENSPIYTFVGNQIEPTTKVELAVSLPGDELSYDTITFKIHYGWNPGLSIPYGTQITYYAGDREIGKFFKKEMKHKGDIYTITAMSAIGLLDRQYHKGGIYNDVPLSDVINEVIRGSLVPDGYIQSRSITQSSASSSSPIVTDVAWTGSMRIVLDAKIEHSGAYNVGDAARVLDIENSKGVSQNGVKVELAVRKCAAGSATENNFWKFTAAQILNQTSLSGYSSYLNKTGVPAVESENVRIVAHSEMLAGDFAINGVESELYRYSYYNPTSSHFIIFPETRTFPYFRFTVYRLKIYDTRNGSNALVGDFVPCANKSKTQVGFYNLVTKRFFGVSRISGYYQMGDYMESFNSFDYEIDPQLNDVLVRGWLPFSTKRENLHQLLIANNVYLLKIGNGKSKFTFLKIGEHELIPAERVLINGEISDAPEVTNVTVVSHLFLEDLNQEPVTLFDNAESGGIASNQIVRFDSAPIIESSIAASGLMLVEGGANYAIVSGTGKLTGIPYLHTTKDYTQVIGDIGETQEIEVRDATMVNNQNAVYVLQKLVNYYAYSRNAKNRLIIENESCGGAYRYYMRRNVLVEAYLKKMSIGVTSMIGADCEFAAGFSPVGHGNAYTHVAVLTGSGTWTIPQSVFEKEQPLIKAVLISGGKGGQTALKGGNGGLAKAYDTAGAKGVGGEGGAGGTGGRIKETGDIDCTNKTSFSYSCGTGGAAGYSSTGVSHVNGSDGGNTTFGSFTTSGSQPIATGYYEELTGTTYAKPGSDGVKGGDGQSGEYNDVAENVTYKGVTYRGGRGGDEIYNKVDVRRHAGGGSGAAAGMYGEAGGSESEQFAAAGAVYIWNQGPGADGVDAIAAETPTIYGTGGNGGNGGSGAGGVSIVEKDHIDARSVGTILVEINYVQTASVGGMPGAPSAGAPGCVIVYY